MSDTRWPHFTRDELACKCGCGKMDMDAEFMDTLEDLRDAVGPLPVTSGYRCQAHDMRVGGSSRPGGGPHTTGKAVDIAITGELAYSLVASAFSRGFDGIGVSQRSGRARFIHLDMASDRPRPRVWSY